MGFVDPNERAFARLDHFGTDDLRAELGIGPDLSPVEPRLDQLVFETHLGTVAVRNETDSPTILELPGHINTALSGEDAISRTDLLEARLVGRFVPLVKDLGLTLPDLMVPVEGQSIRDKNAFTLTPLVAYDDDRPVVFGRSIDLEGEGVPVDPLLTDIYLSTPGVKPWIDSRFAIGLDFGQAIIAVASAGVDREGNLFINQIQAAPGIHRERGHEGWERYNQSGLRHGFYWRHTLVNAWLRIAEDIGCESVIVQSYKNSEYPAVRKHGKSAYDDVAEDMDFIPMSDNNWRLYL